MTSPGSQDQPIVVMGCDDRYAIGLAVTLCSTLSHLPKGESVRLIVVDGGISSGSRKRLERVVNQSDSVVSIEWHEPDVSHFDGLKTSKWGLHPTTCVF